MPTPGNHVFCSVGVWGGFGFGKKKTRWATKGEKGKWKMIREGNGETVVRNSIIQGLEGGTIRTSLGNGWDGVGREKQNNAIVSSITGTVLM